MVIHVIGIDKLCFVMLIYCLLPFMSVITFSKFGIEYLSHFCSFQRETLMRELERERMLRINAEQRLHDVTLEGDTCKSRLQVLQEEFHK